MAVDIDSSILSPSIHDSSNLALSLIHITDALCRSPDHGATLIFSKLSISDLSANAAHALASIGGGGKGGERVIERLAVAHNRLSSLPAEFAHLTHLRYLNLKHNQFTVFPPILTALSALEILDISHNKVTKLPLQAGQLVNLKIFCLSKNQLTTIPSYILQFNKLEVFQIERNPLEWPPDFIIDDGRNIESEQGMKEWIQKLKNWMEMNPKAHLDDEPSYFNVKPEARWRYPPQQVDSLPHARSRSVDSSLSFASIPESISDLPDFEPQRPPPLHLGILSPYAEESSPTKSFESYATSPAETESFDELSFSQLSPNYGFDAPTQHNRNASYAGQEQHPHRTEVFAKMSMPDLRLAKLDFTKTVPVLPQTPDQTSLSDDALASDDRKQVKHQAPPPTDSEFPLPGQLDDEYEDTSNSRVVFSMTSQRNSYFRRLSAFPASVTLPHALLCLVDIARSMLFAACQVYQALDHYIVHVVDERLSSVLRKVLEPASSDMFQLIASLERFDTWSRKMLPPPAICRAIVECCRNTAAAFNKVVRVLALQLQVLTACDDVRYSRLLLVELFAATAEIACAWKNMGPEIPHLKTLLRTHRLVGQGMLSSLETKSKSVMDLSFPIPRHQPNTSTSHGSATVSRARTVRRHAGSFSSKDVEIGKQLPSYDDAPYGSSTSSVSARTQLRTPRRQTTTPAVFPSSQSSSHFPSNPVTSVRSTSRGTDVFDQDHTRRHSHSSTQLPPASSPPSVPTKVPALLELPSSSKVQIDKEALQAVKLAVDVAPRVWDMIETFLQDVLSTKAEIRNGLDNARLLTRRLADMIMDLHENNDLGDKKSLLEDARFFLKAVVQLSNAVRTHKETRNVPLALRNSMIKLTNATEEFAILLHVSSFSPSTPKTISPVVLMQQSDNQLESSLSRSKSARGAPTVKIPMMELPAGPRSALPSQSFKIPTLQRIRGGDVI
ncbi:RAM signaling pathway domain containing protein [Amanita muscaria]